VRKLLTLIVLTVGLTLGVFAATAGAQDDYTPEVGGTVVTEAPSSTGTLPFTGSSNTGSYVLLGLAGIALGGALVIATRRRDEVLHRS
jgi:LPXTG-motif cell wall-anchored protein